SQDAAALGSLAGSVLFSAVPRDEDATPHSSRTAFPCVRTPSPIGAVLHITAARPALGPSPAASGRHWSPPVVSFSHSSLRPARIGSRPPSLPPDPPSGGGLSTCRSTAVRGSG